MLTATQVATVAYASEDAELFCSDCANDGGFYRQVSQYEASEWQTAMNGDSFTDSDPSEHVADCSCEFALECSGCYGEIEPEYEDYQCVERREQAEEGESISDAIMDALDLERGTYDA